MRSRVAIATWIVLAAVATLQAPPSYAQSKSPGSKRPVTLWSKGVSDAAQKRALELFQQGNVFFEQAKYTDAIPLYEQAIAAWDHPNIRFNMAICLINMRQPLTAWGHLTQALRFGDAPLGKRLFAEAMTHRAALESMLAELTVKATQPDVKIMVDGGQVQLGVGEHTMKLLAGRHQVVTTRRGFVTDSRALDLPAGEPVTAEIALKPEKVRVEVQRENYERRWRWWAPWVVAGSAVAVGLTGGGIYLVARSEIKQYDQDLRDLCPGGCPDTDIPAELKNQARSARRKSGVAIGLFAGAGALAITSGVMAILNRPRKVEDHRAVPTLTVSRDYTGIGVSLGFD